jgi:hypothetical protein
MPGCTHPLASIKAQMVTVDAMNLTSSAQSGIRNLGISNEQALAIVQGVCDGEFHKTMDSTKFPGHWQDVYCPWFLATKLYVKFGWHELLGEYNVISFKEK